ncbi:MAG: elongation factor P [Candidatus Komeilibacteria bacterium]|nr:elongation factor P [Candidatus Komeilibacteria bacterium]
MYSISDLKNGVVIDLNNQPYKEVYFQHIKVGRGGANLKTKLKNLITGATLEKTFSGADKITEGNLERSKSSFLYKQGTDYYFMDSTNFEQFYLPEEQLGGKGGFLKEGLEVDVMLYDDKPVAINLPPKVSYLVTATPPGVKGDTVTNASKLATLETGLEIKVPLFINQGESIIVNTDTEEYVSRS